MAKLSSINKNERRKKLVKKYAGQYARLKAIADDETRDDTERLIARLKLAEIPRNGNPTRVPNRCELTGRSPAESRRARRARGARRRRARADGAFAGRLPQVPALAPHGARDGQPGPDPRPHQVEL